jgi:hypothetical protein
MVSRFVAPSKITVVVVLEGVEGVTVWANELPPIAIPASKQREVNKRFIGGLQVNGWSKQ